MSIKEYINGNGTILMDDKFISIRLIKEALERNYRLRIIDESSTHLKAKIIRYARLYGAPILFPNATIDIHIEKEDDKNTLQYWFAWPDYYLVIIGAVIAGIDSRSVVFPLLVLLFGGLLVFLDTKWVSSKINKILKHL